MIFTHDYVHNQSLLQFYSLRGYKASSQKAKLKDETANKLVSQLNDNHP